MLTIAAGMAIILMFLMFPELWLELIWLALVTGAALAAIAVGLIAVLALIG